VPEFGTQAYPGPIVCERLALAAAKERLYGLRSASAVRREAQAIQQQHGSRKSGLPRTDSGKPSKAAGASGTGRRPRPATAPGQGELF
jgi:deoxyribodipyrimidine photo-lyase